ncbi:MAG: response regulator [Bacillota bacterium]
MARILIVDDSIIMRRNLKVILTQAGHEIVAEASNGKEAFVEYEKHMPDLVTMDITMPVLNGIDAVKKIIGSFPDAKIIMISALDQRNMVFEALENGAKHYIIKPITPDKVLTVLDAVLEDTSSGKNENAAEGDSFVNSKAREEAAQTDARQDIQPFTIENKDGTFVVTVSESLDAQNFAPLSMAVQGFMFIKPLSLVFNFSDINDMDADMLNKLVDIINKIKSIGGNVKVISGSNRISEALRLKGIIVETM